MNRVQDVKFKTGAHPTPRHKLAAANPFLAAAAPPPAVAYVPATLSVWGNDAYGDCVTAEEAFAKACHDPEVFIDTRTVEAWATAGGFLNGANLVEVMDAMTRQGFTVGSQTYDDGPHTAVDWSKQALLQVAIATGPVKLGIDHSALPAGAGNRQGWHAAGGAPGRYGDLDHCVSLCGYGPTAWLYERLGVLLPAGLPATGYLLFTWGTIGFVDHAWLMSTCGEAWVRNPTTVGVPPLPAPGPGPAPDPDPGPTPAPADGPSEADVESVVDARFAAWVRVNRRYANLLRDVGNDVDKAIKAVFAGHKQFNTPE